jgi:hypothetical protein
MRAVFASISDRPHADEKAFTWFYMDEKGHDADSGSTSFQLSHGFREKLTTKWRYKKNWQR